MLIVRVRILDCQTVMEFLIFQKGSGYVENVQSPRTNQSYVISPRSTSSFSQSRCLLLMFPPRSRASSVQPSSGLSNKPPRTHGHTSSVLYGYRRRGSAIRYIWSPSMGLRISLNLDGNWCVFRLVHTLDFLSESRLACLTDTQVRFE
jgi:hypothetical protein